MGSTAKDTEMSTHAYDPSGHGTIYLFYLTKISRMKFPFLTYGLNEMHWQTDGTTA